MNFGMAILSQSMETEQNYAIQILIALLFIFLLKIFFEDISGDVELLPIIIIIIFIINLFFADVKIVTVPINLLKSTSKYKNTISQFYNNFFYKLANQKK